MATIGEITQAASYRGDPNLGGYSGIGVTLDVSPLQRLANFTYYRDKDLWEQKQKDDAVAAKNISNIAAFDITTPLPQFSDALKTQLSDIQTFIRENPDALVYSRNPKKYQELNEKINKFSQFRTTATASDAVFNKRKTDIDKETGAKRAVMQKELDMDINEYLSGGVEAAIGKTLKTAPDLKIEDSQIPLAKITEYTVIDEGPNKDIKNKFKFVNLDQLRAESELLAAGAMAAAIDENAPWFKALSPERQQLEREKKSITSEQRQRIKKLSVDFNGLLKIYKEANPDIKLSDVKGDSTGDTLLDNIKWANAINMQIDQLNTLIAGGTLKDPTGRIITKQYEKINLEDGLSEAEIIMMNGIQNAKTPLWSLDKEITQTDNSIQAQKLSQDALQDKRQNALGWFNANTARTNATRTTGTGTPEIKTSGNAFDEIGGTEQIDIVEIKGTGKKQTTTPTGEKIVDGIVYDKRGSKKTGKITIPLTSLPQNMIAALRSAGTDVSVGETVELVVKDGQINSVRTEDGNPISRQAMENAQKKFDTERKGSEPLNWGRTVDKPLTNEDSNLTDAEYFMKYKKARTK